jgi:hypothetical protein
MDAIQPSGKLPVGFGDGTMRLWNPAAAIPSPRQPVTPATRR